MVLKNLNFKVFELMTSILKELMKKQGLIDGKMKESDLTRIINVKNYHRVSK